ncbi:MAG TPA: 4-hydroxythreonine-4-phosphate dehydrogenase PdxA [Cyclobacteriaceae bacterium]|nr:4-hydroxythreonine-4-phosphate dehydrogenase PdxA [Cyclobacteriaceae bacterium]
MTRGNEKPRIGITIGDLNGVGPEVILKALADTRLLSIATPVIYGSSRAISFYKKSMNLEEFNYIQVKAKGQFAPKHVNVVNCWEDAIEINPGKASVETGKAAFKAIEQACHELKEGLIDALVTAPIDKKTINHDAFPFKGHTEYLTSFFDGKESLMLMCSETLKVGLVTEHVPLREVASLITKETITSKLLLLEQSLQKDFGISKPKIAVLGLNPHAGDGGLLGSEEDEIIRPVIIELKNKGKLVSGPFPADGFFGSDSAKKFNGVLAMYHDQGLIPFKTLNFERGVNFTAGLSVIRTSPDHGTAYAIAGKNIADETSIREAIYLAIDVLKVRNEPSKEK